MLPTQPPTRHPHPSLERNTSTLIWVLILNVVNFSAGPQITIPDLFYFWYVEGVTGVWSGVVAKALR